MMVNKLLKDRKLFKWEPNLDLLVGIISLLFMWLFYYGYENLYGSNIILSLLLFVILTNILIAVIFPVWWITSYRKESLSELGITKRYLALSLVLSILLALWNGSRLPNLVIGVNWVPQMIVSALIFWEPFFVFGWLQSIYEKSFGIIPAVLLTALSFILYQIGTISIGGLINVFVVYLVLAVVIGLTRNIFALWPIYWTIGSTTNYLAGGMTPVGWDAVAACTLAILIQLGYIVYIYRKLSTAVLTK